MKPLVKLHPGLHQAECDQAGAATVSPRRSGRSCESGADRLPGARRIEHHLEQAAKAAHATVIAAERKRIRSGEDAVAAVFGFAEQSRPRKQPQPSAIVSNPESRDTAASDHLADAAFAPPRPLPESPGQHRKGAGGLRRLQGSVNAEAILDPAIRAQRKYLEARFRNHLAAACDQQFAPLAAEPE